RAPSGAVYDRTGTYADTVRYSSGCDSLITTIRLTIHPVTVTTERKTICTGGSYTLPSGTVVRQGGTYTSKLLSRAGCDSTVITELTVAPALLTTVTAAICAGSSYTLPTGRTVQTGGTYVETVRSTGGCDSTVTVHLTVRPQPRTTVRASICSGATYTLPSGRVVSAAGIYAETLTTAEGCDSVVTTELAVQPLLRSSVTATICSGAYYTLPSGRRATTAGTHLDTLRYRTGCDSVITTLNLIVTPRSSGITPGRRAVCAGDTTRLTLHGGDRYTWLLPGYTPGAGPASIVVRANVTSTYSAIIHNAACALDDTVYVTVTANPLPVPVVEKSNDVNCTLGIARLRASGGLRYQWTPAESLDRADIPNPMATPDATTVYTVRVTSDKGCTAEGQVEVQRLPGPGMFELPNAYTPNGDGKNDCFGVQTWGKVTNLKFTVFSRWGEVLFETTDPRICWNGIYKGKALPTGVYVYVIEATTQCGPVRRKGTITLIR
ncbi:MAG TPA: gliding motility-associated C-terminal domain-containing protein, partial [Chitinophagaceae bacterium]|nr:gliding motility-associated C-terminal domain-containing protein [Chitinophagaceae bacterium]